MSMSPHIRIQTESYTSHLVLGSSQLVDYLQLGDALHVETENVVVKTEINFPVALANTGIDNLLFRKTCLDTSLYLATTDTVSA